MDETTPPMEMALEAAALVMQSGGSTIAAERCFSSIISGFKERDIAIVWRLDFVAARSSAETESFALVRTLGPIGVDLIRASEIGELAERVANGDVARAAFATEIDRIKHLTASNSRPVTIAAAALVGAAFSQIAGGDWGSLVLAGGAGALGQALRSELHIRRFTAAAITLICGVLSASIGGVGLRMGISQMEAATLMGSVVYLAPGLPLINGFIDVISHKYLHVGLQRIANALFLFLILAIAIALAFKILVGSPGE